MVIMKVMTNKAPFAAPQELGYADAPELNQ